MSTRAPSPRFDTLPYDPTISHSARSLTPYPLNRSLVDLTPRCVDEEGGRGVSLISRAITPLHASPSPSVGTIPSLALPSPIALPVLNSLNAGSRPRKISPVQMGRQDAPRSAGGSTIRPVPQAPARRDDAPDNALYLRDNSLRLDRPHLDARRPSEESTVKLTSYARHLDDYHHILAQLSTRGSVETARPPAVPALGLGFAMVQGVDEVGVEWCVLCGRERDRAEMDLREMSREVADRLGLYGTKGDGKAEDEPEGGGGLWWVCKRDCGSGLDGEEA
ncbi:hypothetical protein EHS25_006267 [Saitozyma podzolica]|uniref:Uncharacterized protein n=1 Tax=Saitozyma podzolica TaxID=1890683 RepID=A0A427YRA9_9TREE|nr:hypothetical protein EHS25_006267 [Saitozyma podzolica]